MNNKKKDDPYSPTDALESDTSSESDRCGRHGSIRNSSSSSSDDSSDDSSSSYEYRWEEAKPAKPPFQPFVSAVNVGAIELPAVKREYIAVIPLKAVLVILFPNNTPEDLEIGIERLDLHHFTKFEADLLTNHVRGLRDSDIRTFTVGTEIYVAEFSRGEIGCSYESLKTEYSAIVDSLVVNMSSTVEDETGYTNMVRVDEVNTTESDETMKCKSIVYPMPMAYSRPKEIVKQNSSERVQTGESDTDAGYRTELQRNFSKKCNIAHVGDKLIDEQNCKKRKHRRKASSESSVESIKLVEKERSSKRANSKSKVAVVLKHLYPENEEDEDWSQDAGDGGRGVKRFSTEASKKSKCTSDDTDRNNCKIECQSSTDDSEKSIKPVRRKSNHREESPLSVKISSIQISESIASDKEKRVDEGDAPDTRSKEPAAATGKSALGEKAIDQDALKNSRIPVENGEDIKPAFDSVVHRLPLDYPSSEDDPTSPHAEWTVTDSYTCQSPDAVDTDVKSPAHGSVRSEGSVDRSEERGASPSRRHLGGVKRPSTKSRSPSSRDSRYKIDDRDRKGKDEMARTGVVDVSPPDSRLVVRRVWRPEEKYGGSGQRTNVFGGDNRIIQRTTRFVPDYSKLRFRYRRELYSPVSSTETDFGDDDDGEEHACIGEMSKHKVLRRRSDRDDIRMRSKRQDRETSTTRSDASSERSSVRSGSAQSKSRNIAGQRECLPRFPVRRENTPEIDDVAKKQNSVGDSECLGNSTAIKNLVVGIRHNCDNRIVRYRDHRSKDSFKPNEPRSPRRCWRTYYTPRCSRWRRRSHSPSCVRSFSPSPRQIKPDMRARRRSLTPISNISKVDAHGESFRYFRPNERGNNRQRERSSDRKGGGASDAGGGGNECSVSRSSEIRYSSLQRDHNATLNDGSHATNVGVRGSSELMHSCYGSPFTPFSASYSSHEMNAVEFSMHEPSRISLKPDRIPAACAVGGYPDLRLHRPASDDEQVIILKGPQELNSSVEDLWPFLSSGSDHDSSMEDSCDGEVEGFMFRTLKRWREQSALKNSAVVEAKCPGYSAITSTLESGLYDGAEGLDCSILEDDNTRNPCNQSDSNQSSHETSRIETATINSNATSPKKRQGEKSAEEKTSALNSNSRNTDPTAISSCNTVETNIKTCSPNVTTATKKLCQMSVPLQNLNELVMTAVELKDDNAADSPCAHEEIIIQNIDSESGGVSTENVVGVLTPAMKVPMEIAETEVRKQDDINALAVREDKPPDKLETEISDDTDESSTLDSTCIGANITIEGERNEDTVTEGNVRRKERTSDAKSWKKLLLQKAQIDSSSAEVDVSDSTRTADIFTKLPAPKTEFAKHRKRASIPSLTNSTTKGDFLSKSNAEGNPDRESINTGEAESSVTKRPDAPRVKVSKIPSERNSRNGISIAVVSSPKFRENLDNNITLDNESGKDATSNATSEDVKLGEVSNAKYSVEADHSEVVMGSHNKKEDDQSLLDLAFEVSSISTLRESPIFSKEEQKNSLSTSSGCIADAATISNSNVEKRTQTTIQSISSNQEGMLTKAGGISSSPETDSVQNSSSQGSTTTTIPSVNFSVSKASSASVTNVPSATAADSAATSVLPKNGVPKNSPKLSSDMCGSASPESLSSATEAGTLLLLNEPGSTGATAAIVTSVTLGASAEPLDPVKTASYGTSSIVSAPDICATVVATATASLPTESKTSLNNNDSLCGQIRPVRSRSSSNVTDISLPSNKFGDQDSTSENTVPAIRTIASLGSDLKVIVATRASRDVTMLKNAELAFAGSKFIDQPDICSEAELQRRSPPKEILTHELTNKDLSSVSKIREKDTLGSKMLFSSSSAGALKTTPVRTNVAQAKTAGANVALANRGTFRGPQLKHKSSVQKTIATSGNERTRSTSLPDQPTLVSNRPEFMSSRVPPASAQKRFPTFSKPSPGPSAQNVSIPSVYSSVSSESSDYIVDSLAVNTEHPCKTHESGAEFSGKAGILHHDSTIKTGSVVSEKPLKSILRKPTANFDVRLEDKIPERSSQVVPPNTEPPMKSVEESLQEGESVIQSLLPLIKSRRSRPKKRKDQSRKLQSEKESNGTRPLRGRSRKRGSGRGRGRPKKRKRLPSISSDEDIIEELNAGVSQPLPKRAKSLAPQIESSESEVEDSDDDLVSFMGIATDSEMANMTEEQTEVKTDETDKSEGDREGEDDSTDHDNPFPDFSTDSDEDGKPLSELVKKISGMQTSREENSKTRASSGKATSSNDDHENIFTKLSKEIERLEAPEAKLGQDTFGAVAKSDSEALSLPVTYRDENSPGKMTEELEVLNDKEQTSRNVFPAMPSSSTTYDAVGSDAVQPFLPTPPTSPKSDFSPSKTDMSNKDISIENSEGKSSSGELQVEEKRTVPESKIHPIGDDAKSSLSELSKQHTDKEVFLVGARESSSPDINASQSVIRRSEQCQGERKQRDIPCAQNTDKLVAVVPPVRSDYQPTEPQGRSCETVASEPVLVRYASTASVSTAPNTPQQRPKDVTEATSIPSRCQRNETSQDFVSIATKRTEGMVEKRFAEPDGISNLIAAAAELAGVTDSGGGGTVLSPASGAAPRQERVDNPSLAVDSPRLAVPKRASKQKDRVSFTNYSMPEAESCHGFLEVCMSAPVERIYALRRIPYVKTNADVPSSNTHSNQADPPTSSACATYLRLRDVICLIKVHPEVLFSLVLRCEATLYWPNDYTRRLFGFVYDPVCNTDDDLAKMTMRHNRGERLQEFLDHMIVLDKFLHSLLPRFYHEGLSVHSSDVPKFVSVKIFKPISAINDDVVKIFRRPYMYNSMLRNKDDRIKCNTMERRKFSLPSSNPRKRKSSSESVGSTKRKAPLPHIRRVAPTPVVSMPRTLQDDQGFSLQQHPQGFYLSAETPPQYQYSNRNVAHSQYGPTPMQSVFYRGGMLLPQAVSAPPVGVLTSMNRSNAYGGAEGRQLMIPSLEHSRIDAPTSTYVTEMPGSNVIRFSGVQRSYVVQDAEPKQNMTPTAHHLRSYPSLSLSSDVRQGEMGLASSPGEHPFICLSSGLHKLIEDNNPGHFLPRQRPLLDGPSAPHLQDGRIANRASPTRKHPVARLLANSQVNMNAAAVEPTNLSEPADEHVAAPDCQSSVDENVAITSVFSLPKKNEGTDSYTPSRVDTKCDRGRNKSGSPTTKEFLMDLPSILSQQKKKEGRVDDNPATQNAGKLSGIDILAEAAAKVYAMSEDDENEMLKGNISSEQGIDPTRGPDFAHLSGVVSKLQSRVKVSKTKNKRRKRDAGQKKAKSSKGKMDRKKVELETLIATQ